MASSRKSPKNNALPARIAAVLKQHVQRDDRLVVGLSGGIDSVVLLDLLHRAARSLRFSLAAVHVNHQLSPSANAWAKFCRVLCREYAIPLTVKKVSLKPGNSLEASARKARYAVYAAQRCDAIVLAHNQDDQVETLLLQLLRGTGVKGASAMAEYRNHDSGIRIQHDQGAGKLNPESRILNPAVIRPLLDVPRSEIAAYAKKRKLVWIEDDSNANTAFDRNFVRHRVLPVIAERFPAYRHTLSRASRNFSEAAALIDAFAAADIAIADGVLDLAPLRALSAVRVKNALRYFLSFHGVLMPSARRLEECARQLMRGGAAARTKIVLGVHELRRYGDQLHVVAVSAAAPGRLPAVHWRGEKQLDLPQFGGTLIMRAVRGRGIRLAGIAHKPVTLRGREGGEKLQPDPRRPRRTLKNLWQELRIPEWQRSRQPLLYVGDDLVYVAGLGIDARFQAAAGEAGIAPDWHPDAA